MKYRYTTQYFPFAPGIRWTIQNNKYIIPKINESEWYNFISGKNIVVIGYGGLLESFYSLSIIEALSSLNFKTSWQGNSIYELLIKKQRISTIYKNGPDINQLNNYPVPLFCDKNNNVYINYLNNYLTIKGFAGYGEKPNKASVIEQLFSNSLLPWYENYRPMLREEGNAQFNNWCHQNRFHLNKPYILLLPDKTIFSSHNIDCMRWSNMEIRSFISMTRNLGLSVLIATNDKIDQFYGLPIINVPLDLNIIIKLIQSANFLLSRDIDFILMALSLSQSCIISNKIDGAFDIHKNSDYLNSANIIYTSNNLTPLEAYHICKEI